MTRILPRTKFHSSELIRCLADLDVLDAVDSGNAFAEKLGLWIHFADAIALSAVHSESVTIVPKIQHEAKVATRIAAIGEVDRIQALLVNSIMESFLPNSVKAHISLPASRIELPFDLVAGYVPYRRFYEAHQRDMELRIQPLRTNVREALAKMSPKLKKLADLDATLETILREREGKLLSRVPLLLRKRFEQLFKEHQQRLADARQADDPAGWMQAGNWLARFCNDMQMLLLAEVELRLQPVTGLIEAFDQDTQ